MHRRIKNCTFWLLSIALFIVLFGSIIGIAHAATSAPLSCISQITSGSTFAARQASTVVSRGSCSSQCTPDYCQPADWNTRYTHSLTSGVEPLNVIISARSTVPLNSIQKALHEWRQVPTGTLKTSPKGCLSQEEANVNGGYMKQQESWRLGNCDSGNIRSFLGKEDHARLWRQPVPGSKSGAWFMAASYETACINTTAGLEPLKHAPHKHLSSAWHCIDGGKGSYGANGYDYGAMTLANDLVQAAQKKGWPAVVRTSPRPAGIGEDGVRFGSTVYVVTVNYPTP